MSARTAVAAERSTLLQNAVRAACDTIAPAWPLDRFIAVNPLWGRTRQPFARAAESVARLGGAHLFMPMAYYRDAWEAGEIGRTDLEAAIVESDVPESVEGLIEAWDTAAATSMLPLPSELADRRRDLSHQPGYGKILLQQVSEFCAGFFDRRQADWRPERAPALYAAWRETLVIDAGLERLLGLPGFRRRTRMLPPDPDVLIEQAVDSLAPPAGREQDFLSALLLRVNGWAGWCAYLGWLARRRGAQDSTLSDLLAIRLAWEWLLDDGRRGAGSVWSQWKQAWSAGAVPNDGRTASVAAVWQRALEIAYQRRLTRSLGARRCLPEKTEPRPEAQAVFCIDVRSEVFRRALEEAMPGVQTLGFAGFFGVPLAYRPLGTRYRVPQVPGLLEPDLEATDSTGDAAGDASLESALGARLARRNARERFARLPASAFTLVETLGFGYMLKLLRRSFPQSGDRRGGARIGPPVRGRVALGPCLTPGPGNTERDADVAERALRGMGLTRRHARLVALVGHASTSANNPHAASLDCGACCGQTGEVNARILAGILNDGDTRAELARRGIDIPRDTHFLAALHNTTLDEVTVFDSDGLPPGHREDVERLRAAFAAAGRAARAERAPALGLAGLAGRPRALQRSLRRRAADWSQTRPEWGLAGNAAFVAAPRRLTRGLDLAGRVFLHDYDCRDDRDGSVLELIMTAPMVVAHWINMQYYASTVDNVMYGSGNKVLHNVVGGCIGVFEGNGGDLRTGLPLQSLRDGSSWRHTPLRLSVYVAASAAAIDAVLERHEHVRDLVENEWLFLFRIDPAGGAVERRCRRRWRPA